MTGVDHPAGPGPTDRPVGSHYELLAEVHARLRPRRYLEIGVDLGWSLRLAAGCEVAVGVDPEPRLDGPLPPACRLWRGTSDELFATTTADDILGGPADLVFVDGLHLFEQALADVCNAERWCHPGSLILVHDCLPTDRLCASRQRRTLAWAGDTFKVVPCLRRTRPDLRIVVIDVAPTGMAAVDRLDPGGHRPVPDPGPWMDHPWPPDPPDTDARAWLASLGPGGRRDR